MVDADHCARVKACFERINDAVLGERMEIVVEALMDLMAASCCYAADSRLEAEKIGRSIAKDLGATIKKNFDHYHDRANAKTVAGVAVSEIN